MAAISIENAKKSYGSTEVLHGVSLDISDGEFLILVGPSGCGKSTLLRMIAGLETITSGDIILDNEIINALLPRHRDIAMVFQSYALYPHMTVRKNMAYSLKLAGASKAEIKEKVATAAKVLDLESLLDRKPAALSGGHIEQIGTPMELYDFPQTLFVATFIGSPAMNMINGTLNERGEFVTSDGTQIVLGGVAPKVAGNVAAVLGVRPEHTQINGQGIDIGTARVRVVEPTGSETLLTTSLDNEPLLVLDRERGSVVPGETIDLTVKPTDFHFFEQSTGKRIN